MRFLLRIFSAFHAVLSLLFAIAAVLLSGIAVRTGWAAVVEGFDEHAAQTLIEGIGLAAVAVVALQIGQTIAEEEVIREAHVSAPTRVRRFLSRFLVVVTVAEAIEGLVATFKTLHEDPSQLVQAAAPLFAAAATLAGWGIFVWCNRAAEELEPEAMEKAKREDRKLE